MTTARPTLNFDAPEPAATTDPNASALFPSQPVYARKPSRKTSRNLPLLIGLPVVAIVGGGLIWAMSANRAETPTDPQSLKTAAAQTEPAATPVPSNVAATPTPIPQPTELAANETPAPAPAPVARSTAPRAAAPARPAARRAAPVRESAPDASSASTNVSTTVPATPPAVSAPAVPEPAPLVVPPPAPAPAAQPSSPM